MPYKKIFYLLVSVWDTFIKKNILKTIKKKILRDYKKKIYLLGSLWDTFIKKNFFATIKKFSSQL